ncbi:MAG: beta-propeller fold lactonase family protein [Anaerolineae bacterium]|nr:beta-propeller fold lactonase family protein [Anaerolineae bacterium]
MKRKMLFLIVLSLLMFVPLLAQAADEPGAVYAMTNANDGNEIVVYHRAADGLLTQAGTYSTHGDGETTEPDDALGSEGPILALSPDHRFLFAVNAGSDTIAAFQIDQDNLTFLEVVDSHGDLPVSLTVHNNLLYVLNARGGGNISGFTVDNNGHLTYLEGSTRPLNADTPNTQPFFLNSPAQVGFNPVGDKLVVTVKGALVHQPKIHVFTVDGNGLPSAQPVTTDYPDVSVSFGFAFDDLNNLIVAEPFGAGFPPPGPIGAASSYRIAADGSLTSISDTVSNDQVATCWIAITTNTRFAYSTNNGGDGEEEGGTISSYKVGSDGSLSLINGIAGRTGDAPVDLAITPSNQYLYNVNAGSGTVSMFKIEQKNGNLIPLGEIAGLPDDGSAVGIAAR